jgi:hypothetical protein
VKRDRYTITYRAAEAHQVMNWIKAGQSGCLIGLRGAGKSNFLRFLLREDVRWHYLGRDYADFVLVLIDLLALTEYTNWAVCELILDRLLAQLRLFSMETEIIEGVASLHQEAMRLRDPLTAYRALEQCVDLLCRRPAQCVALLFDEFDTAFRTLDPFLFRCLRAIRDAHKGHVSYIVVVDDDLACLRDDLDEVEHFHRLMSRNIRGLGPYNQADAQQMISYLASQRSIELGAGDAARLIELSGGHAGLLKAILSLLGDARQDGGLVELAPILKDEPAVHAECQKVWDSLSEGEQTALCTLASGMVADPDALHRLERKGLVREGRSGSSIFSPLFADFVCQQAPPLPTGTVISRFPRVVQIEGRRIEGLRELEFEALCYLYENRGKVCRKDDLIKNVYGQQYEDMTGGVTDGALQTLISRLRSKIGPLRYIVTVRGEGYKFVESGSSRPRESY